MKFYRLEMGIPPLRNTDIINRRFIAWQTGRYTPAFNSGIIREGRTALSCPVQKISGPSEMGCLQPWEAAFITDGDEILTDQGHHIRRVFP